MATNEQQLRQRLERLNAALHSGEKTIITSDGASVTYRSLEEMLQARRDIEGQLQAQALRPRMAGVRVTFTTVRGG